MIGIGSNSILKECDKNSEPNTKNFAWKFSTIKKSYKTSKLGRRFLGTHLFVKVPWPGDNEGTFSVIESSCHLLLPV